jgi:hypothetical protein
MIFAFDHGFQHASGTTTITALRNVVIGESPANLGLGNPIARDQCCGDTDGHLRIIGVPQFSLGRALDELVNRSIPAGNVFRRLPLKACAQGVADG